LKSVWGCYFDVQIVPGFLFLRFCGNLKSQVTEKVKPNDPTRDDQTAE